MTKSRNWGKYRLRNCINVDLFKENMNNTKSRLPWRKMLRVGRVAIFPDSVQCTSELAHICENKNVNCNLKWARKQEIPEECSRQHWFSRNFLLYTMGQAMCSSPVSMCQMSGLRKPPEPFFLTQGFMGKTPSCARSPLSDMTVSAAFSVTAFASCRSMTLYPKEILFDMCLSKYQLFKIKMRQIHELSKLAIPNHM